MNSSTPFSGAATVNVSHSQVPKMALQFSTERDIDRIIAYYVENSHHHVHVRRRDWIAQHASAGQFMLGTNNDGDIIASSALYDYMVEGDDPGGLPSYYEVGSTNFKKPGGAGYGLYPLFIASQVIEAFLEMAPRQKCIANVYDSSPVGTQLLVGQVGWVTIEPTEDILEKFKSTKSSDHSNDEPMTWYASQSQCLPHQARIVLHWIQKAEAYNRKADMTMALDFSDFALAKQNRPLVEEIAYGDFGRFLESRTHIPLQDAQRLLRERYLPECSRSTYKPRRSGPV